MKALIKFLVVCTTSIMLFACGGGEESLTRDGGGPTTTPDPDLVATYSVAVSIADNQGNAANELSEGNPLIITTTLTATNGGIINDVLVTFSLSQVNLATFNNDTATALTNADGIAVIGLEVGSLRGDGVVSASIEAGASGTVGFSSAGIQEVQIVPASLELFATQVQMASSGDDKVELIAVVKNEQNVLLEGVVVAFSADAGSSIESVSGSTGPDGKATATLTTENNRSNRLINVTASTASLTDSLSVDVVGTEININGASSVIINDQAPITFNLVDSSGIGISGQQLTLSTDVGQLDNIAPITGANGQVTVNFTAISSGQGTISASALNAFGSLQMTVQQDDFSFSSLPEADVPLQTDQSLSIRWFKNNAAFVGGSVTITTSRGIIATPTVTTDSAGTASVSIRSEFAGPASISASGTDADGNRVTARANIEFIATQVQSVFVDATPDLIGPEGQTSTISAVVRDPSGNLVKGKVVDFTLIDSNGGSIEPNSATTGSDGIASTVYTSNAVSPEDGVTIQATADGVVGQVDLTVGDRAFDISIGTGNEIEDQDPSTYLKEFAVFVSDSVGRPVESAALTASATPIKLVNDGSYRKGVWIWDADNEIWFAATTIECANEDLNNNGRLDAGEDTNNDGELTPGIIGTISFKDSISRTNAAGQATLELRYPKQFAVWVGVEVSVFGQSSGSEARDSQTLILPIATTDIASEVNQPPSNPFGFGSTCTDPN
ncbi:MAG: hypothetical protein ACJAYN_001816 [Bermanella sp.]|jgi:hypothetical protein|uniref:Ig-like domain-containing protein n=1 Tax=Glaciecola sp. 33A TaxID=2057807 RepID=UPI001E350740|nr:Ig-like domain-containing protein [Glaciecola sp. 33A]